MSPFAGLGVLAALGLLWWIDRRPRAARNISVLVTLLVALDAVALSVKHRWANPIEVVLIGFALIVWQVIRRWGGDVHRPDASIESEDTAHV